MELSFEVTGDPCEIERNQSIHDLFSTGVSSFENFETSRNIDYVNTNEIKTNDEARTLCTNMGGHIVMPMVGIELLFDDISDIEKFVG